MSFFIILFVVKFATHENLQWLKGVWQSHGSVTVTSFSQAEAINERGVYVVGIAENVKGSLPTLQTAVSLKISECNDGRQTVHDNKSYSLADIKDLQSKLVLVTAKEEKKEILQVFLTVS